MSLSNELVSQFVKATKDDTKPNSETTVYGTTVEYDGKLYVKLDGSDLLTPVSKTTDARSDERVTVLIKDHTATITGNMSSPAARTDDVQEIGSKITEVEVLVSEKVSTKDLEAESGRIDTLVSENVYIKEKLTANEAKIGELEADNVTINGTLTAQDATIKKLETEKLDADAADIKFATIDNLDATNANVHNLEATYGEFEILATNKFEAIDADIKRLDAESIDVENLDAKYANIDFANIGDAAIETFFAKSGMVEDVVISDGTITGTLVGVTIKGDLIEGGTIVADKLVIKGTDGLYYKLNTDGVKTEAEQTDYNSINGSIITAKSITATKINVDDLVAFDATIGGFKITSDSLYSGVKSSADNTTRGIYMDDTGQLVVGDSQNYIKYYKDTDGTYKLGISAGSIMLSASGKDVEDAINDVEQQVSDIEIGGRNLLLNSDFSDGFEHWETTTAAEHTEYDSVVCAKIVGRTDGYDYVKQDITDKIDLDDLEQKYTYSLDFRIEDYVSNSISEYTHVRIRYHYTNESGTSTFNDCGQTSLLEYAGQGWTRVSGAFTLPRVSTAVTLYVWTGYHLGDIYFKNLKLEKGNKATDWTPAPEDVDQEISNVETRVTDIISEKETSILATSEEITMTALSSYVETSEYEEFKEHVSTELSVQSDEITMQFDGLSKTVTEIDGELQSTVEQWSKHISFSEDGIILTSGPNAIELQLDNEEGIIFRKDGVRFGAWDGENFLTGNILIRVNERAQLGNFSYVPRSDGSLSFFKLGNEIVIISHPTPLTTTAGTSVTMSVEATGMFLSYQWQRGIRILDSSGSLTWTSIAGATNRNYTFTAQKVVSETTNSAGFPITIEWEQYYRCIVTDALGANTTTESAQLIVD